MIRLLAVTAISLFCLGGLYLSFWPIPIDPQSWDAPTNPGYSSDYAVNARLSDMDHIALGDYHGPEDIISHEGYIYTSSQDGVILRIDPITKTSAVLADTKGRPLGMEMDADNNLIVADAYLGLLNISLNGEISLLTDRVGPSPILYADDVDIGADGTLYFTDASTRFGARASKSTLDASLLELMEHGRTGRLLAYNPRDKSTRIIARGFSFANGVAMESAQSVLMIETGRYRVLRVFVSGPKTGQHEVVIDNLPGFPDNINRGSAGDDGHDTFWLGLVSPRSDWLDKHSAKPFMRAVAMRLPESMRPQAQNYSFVMQINSRGEVLQTLQDPKGAYPLSTGAIEGDDGWLYITSLSTQTLGRVKLSRAE